MLQGLEEGPDDGARAQVAEAADDRRPESGNHAVCGECRRLIYFLFNIFQNFGYMEARDALRQHEHVGRGLRLQRTTRPLLPAGELRLRLHVFSTWTYNDNKCRQFTYGEVMRKLEDGGFYIQDLRLGHRGRSTRTAPTTRPDAGYVPACRRTPPCPASTTSRSSSSTASRPQQGESKLMPNDGLEEGGRLEDDKNKPEESFDEKNPFKMTLTDLLELAGIDSLDDWNYAGRGEEGTPAFRMTGMVIELQIDYTNKIPRLLRG